MKPFSQLLNEYVQRSGISDTELARAVGVSRQTIFRWREGQTARPRYRADVLVIVKKLRLTPEERDELLLAAGFHPEESLVETQGSAIERGSKGAGEQGQAVLKTSSPAQMVETELAKAAGTRREIATRPSENERFDRKRSLPGRPGLLAAATIGVVILVGLIWFNVWWVNQARVDSLKVEPSPPTSNLSQVVTPTIPEPTIILITHFANYASSQAGYNVAGRLAEALQREIDDIRLAGLRLQIWPEAVAEREEALQAGQKIGATLVIYGEYDAGRVVVKFAHPADQSIFADPALRQHVVNLEDLSTAINSDLPRQVRSLALIALGQIYLKQEAPNQALSLLTQAHDNLQGDPQIEAQTWAVANFFLGTAHQRNHPPNLDAAILAYSEAVEKWPAMIASRLNRSAAYEARNQPGDLELALADADVLVSAAPEWALAYNNRASIRLTMGGQANLDLALVDLEQTLALEPNLPEAYLNRTIAHFGQGQTVAEVRPDLETALELRPDYGSALNLLCWGYSLEAEPETAMPYCRQAVESAPDEPLFRDSRGVAYALLGDYPAASADFEAYATWLETKQPGPDGDRDLSRRRAWIEVLERDENPFTPQLLAILRAEFGQ